MDTSGVSLTNLSAVFSMGHAPVPSGNKVALANPLGDGFYTMNDKRRSQLGFYFPDGTEAAFLATLNAAILVWNPNVEVAVVDFPEGPDVPWWIVSADGETFRTIGCYQQRRTLFVTNLGDPYCPVQLNLDQCGKTWFPIKASSKKEAKANARTSSNLAYCERIRKGLISADRALRREVS